MKENADLIERIARDIYGSSFIKTKVGFEWAEFSTEDRERYRKQAIYLLARYHITRKATAVEPPPAPEFDDFGFQKDET